VTGPARGRGSARGRAARPRGAAGTRRGRATARARTVAGRPLRIDRRGAVGVLTLHRPLVRNAIDGRMIEALHAALDRLAADRTLRALILTGAGGRAFASGADIRELRRRRAADALRGINSALFQKVEEFPVPTIAAVRGYALGGGCELALACDLRVAGVSARFGQPEVGLGIIPAAGATQRLPRLIGLGRARDLILTGRIIDAREALAIGLVNRVVPDDRVLQEARALALMLASKSPIALRVARLALSASSAAVEAGRIAERLGQGILFESEDRDEGMDAFLAGRRPRFSGR
jgi:enoyl-CoA hydratase